MSLCAAYARTNPTLTNLTTIATPTGLAPPPRDLSLPTKLFPPIVHTLTRT
jgi:hypothetical protein